ncbi:MAG: hypothetical protein AAFY71_21080 [Bacteroidota bacterium]
MSNLQKELLKLYAHDVSEQQLLEIKRMLGRYFAEEATRLMDDFSLEKGLTAESFEAWAQDHHRSESSS